MICFNILKVFFLLFNLLSATRLIFHGLLHLHWHGCGYNTTVHEFMWNFLKEWEIFCTPSHKAEWNSRCHTHRGIKDLFFLFLESPLSPRCPVFVASTHAVAGKARHSFVWLGGTTGCGQQPQSRSCPLLRQLSCCFTDLCLFLFISSFCCPCTHSRVMNRQWQVKLKQWDEYVWHPQKHLCTAGAASVLIFLIETLPSGQCSFALVFSALASDFYGIHTSTIVSRLPNFFPCCQVSACDHIWT